MSCLLWVGRDATTRRMGKKKKRKSHPDKRKVEKTKRYNSRSFLLVGLRRILKLVIMFLHGETGSYCYGYSKKIAIAQCLILMTLNFVIELRWLTETVFFQKKEINLLAHFP